jgi:hypothetical protein
MWSSTSGSAYTLPSRQGPFTSLNYFLYFYYFFHHHVNELLCHPSSSVRDPLRLTSTARLTGSDNSDKQQLSLSFYLSASIKSNGNPTGRPCVSFLLESLRTCGEYRIRTDDPLLAKQVL